MERFETGLWVRADARELPKKQHAIALCAQGNHVEI
jgi:hypothetical protein